MAKLKIVAPLHFLLNHPRDTLPDKITLEENFTIERFNPDLVDNIVNLFTDFYSKHDINELKNCRFCVVFVGPESNHEKISDGQAKVHHLIESLRIVRPTRVVCSTFVFHHNEGSILDPQGASQKTNPVFLVNPEVGDTHFTNQDVDKIKRYYLKVEELYQKHKNSYNRMLNAFIFFQLGYLTHYAKLRVVPFTISLESLFNTSEQEIGYSLRMRCASFLGKNKEEKLELIEKLKKIYQIRSATVHGGPLPNKMLKDPNEANKLLKDLEDVARLCFQKIFDQNLEGLFNQNTQNLSKSLDALMI